MAASKDASAEQALYLKADALFQARKFAAAVTAADQLTAAFPKSDWRFKALFLKAQALIEEKKFAEASAIYQEESTRILSSDRKLALVGEILRFAEKLETVADSGAPDAPKADFDKAYALYSKALAIELPRDFRDDIVYRKARAIQQANKAAQAIQDFQAYLTEYDPTWTGAAGSGAARLPMVNPPPAGKHVAMARFRLAESLSQSGDPDAARLELEDLLKKVLAWNFPPALFAELRTVEGQKLAEEIRWLQVRTYFQDVPNALANSNNGGGANRSGTTADCRWTTNSSIR